MLNQLKIDQMRRKADALEKINAALRRFLYHHESQAKPQTNPVTKAHNLRLAEDAREALEQLKYLP